MYADGYCEQWGSATVNATVTLTKKYADSLYNITLGIYGQREVPSVVNTAPTVNSFMVSVYQTGSPNATHKIWWRTCGYLADDQYEHYRRVFSRYYIKF